MLACYAACPHNIYLIFYIVHIWSVRYIGSGRKIRHTSPDCTLAKSFGTSHMSIPKQPPSLPPPLQKPRDPIAAQVGANLRKEREKRGWSAKDLEKKLDFLADDWVKLFEGGHRRGGAGYLYALCRELEISPENLFLRAEEYLSPADYERVEGARKKASVASSIKDPRADPDTWGTACQLLEVFNRLDETRRRELNIFLETYVKSPLNKKNR